MVSDSDRDECGIASYKFCRVLYVSSSKLVFLIRRYLPCLLTLSTPVTALLLYLIAFYPVASRGLNVLL